MPSAIRVLSRIQDQDDFAGALNNGQFLTYSSGTGKFSLAAVSSGTVTSVSGSGGTTGLTLGGGPITGSGTLTLGGTLAVANGGTGQTSAQAAINALLPATDTTPLVAGSSDATKKLRIEVDGFTAGATRVLTPPDQDGTLAVLERAQAWTQTQTFVAPTSGKAVVARAAGTTPGNIQEWQSSGGAALTQIGFGGGLNLPEDAGDLAGGQSGSIGFGTNSFGIAWATGGGGAKGLAYQSGGTWQLKWLHNSGFVANALRGAYGFSAGDTVAVSGPEVGIYRAGTGILGVFYDSALAGNWGAAPGALRVGAPTASTIPLAVQGIASQTGVLLQLQGQSDTTAGRAQADVDTAWVSATDASRKARLVLRAWDTAAREVMRGEGSGSVALIGFLGAAAVAQQAIGAAATDAGTTQTLANNIRTALINLGLCKT